MERSHTHTSTVEAVPRKKGSVVSAILSVLIVACALTAGYSGYVRVTNGYFPWASEDERQAASLSTALDAVKQLMIVPDEKPFLIEVTDAKAVKQQQAFFQNAETGDQLLIFPTSRQAVVYSPTKNLIVNVGPIEYGTTPQGATAVQAQNVEEAPKAPAK